ncbi:hypothetical protein M430DRAFT_59337 [Amorphotheca resinae ATCC 22711]|uniref:RING-type domain-containing protein n=1 Tax=Amorphotheca resinae ATCC 22711 TaxID=857342 RepID=A0A2T3B0L1_AMORE|nr:hypothetical protein M430DRAFT_59337 [Amorphotheca resinae ATCC 22711]PSS16947.1 hypothetical protein M430DRAFT_59337 [Amorphotheca resinae ATCC 22711]
MVGIPLMSGVWNMSGMNLDTDTSPLGPKAWALQIQKNEAEKIIREAKERAEARVKARQLRLKVTEDHDRQIDRHLFAEGPDPIPIDIFGGKTLFQWQDMTGDQNYILQQLSTLIAKSWDQQKLDEVEQLICNMDWIRAPYSGHPVDTEALSHLRQDIVLESLRIGSMNQDGNNVETKQSPLPDGTNLESASLRVSWILHRAWIRALHYRSLHAGPHNYGGQQIKHILALSLFFLEGEARKIEAGLDELKSPPEFEALNSCATTLTTALIGVARDVVTESRPTPSDRGFTLEETFAYNTDPRRFSLIYSRHFDNVNRLWQLWAYLLAVSDDFDRRMDYEHVEDTLISKRVVVADESWEVAQALKGGKQLYYIFDTAPAAQDYFLEPIKTFYEQIDTLVQLEKSDPECKYQHPSPSSRANVWAGLFPIHPVASTHPESYSLVNCNYEGGCAICQEAFAPAYVIVKLHCNHLFHYTCVRQMWDLSGINTFSCPLCRSNSVRWALHEQVGILPEVLDVWDHEATVGVDLARAHPDFEDEESLYWVRENEKLSRSETWNEKEGDRPRDVDIEMANVRQARRRRNKRLRQNASLSDTVEGLDPIS